MPEVTNLSVSPFVSERERFEWEQDEADKKLLWERYQLLSKETIDYLCIVLYFSSFYYTTTGAILSFIFSREDYQDLIVALWLPIVFGFLIGLSFISFAINQRHGNEDLERIAKKLFVYTHHKEQREISKIWREPDYARLDDKGRAEYLLKKRDRRLLHCKNNSSSASWIICFWNNFSFNKWVLFLATLDAK